MTRHVQYNKQTFLLKQTKQFLFCRRLSNIINQETFLLKQTKRFLFCSLAKYNKQTKKYFGREEIWVIRRSCSENLFLPLEVSLAGLSLWRRIRFHIVSHLRKIFRKYCITIFKLTLFRLWGAVSYSRKYFIVIF